MFYCQKRLRCNYNCLHPITLIKIELFYIYFSRILANGAEQLFCLTPPSNCLQKSLKRKNKQTHLEKNSKGFNS